MSQCSSLDSALRKNGGSNVCAKAFSDSLLRVWTESEDKISDEKLLDNIVKVVPYLRGVSAKT